MVSIWGSTEEVVTGLRFRICPDILKRNAGVWNMRGYSNESFSFLRVEFILVVAQHDRSSLESNQYELQIIFYE